MALGEREDCVWQWADARIDSLCIMGVRAYSLYAKSPIHRA